MTDNQQETCSTRIIHTERIEKAHQKSLPPSDHEKLVNLFKAMGDPSRLRILFALASGEMCVCDLAAFLGITESAVSHQLRVLRQLYLVANRREGPILYYSLNDHHIEQLINIGLDHVRE
jgi:DNA-binding transcriptional ArsR family regulator